MTLLTEAELEHRSVPTNQTSRRRRRGPWSKGNRAAAVCFFVFAIGLIGTFTARFWVGTDPNEQTLELRLRPPVFAGGSWSHPLGTDELGRDMFSRLVYGGQVSYSVGLVAAIGAATIGIALGILAGYRRGWVESLILRMVDVLTAFPFLIIAITIVALIGPSLRTIIITLIIFEWVPFARLAHAKTLTVKQTEYFTAAVATGRRPAGIAIRHVLPNIAPPLVVIGTSVIARSIIFESSLSFLGLGVPPPRATWGGMLAAGRQYLDGRWWIPVLPGLAIVIVVVSINVVGDWLSDRWDPRD
jgi:peptide/nickel transport system permease protein